MHVCSMEKREDDDVVHFNTSFIILFFSSFEEKQKYGVSLFFYSIFANVSLLDSRSSPLLPKGLLFLPPSVRPCV